MSYKYPKLSLFLQPTYLSTHHLKYVDLVSNHSNKRTLCKFNVFISIFSFFGATCLTSCWGQQSWPYMHYYQSQFLWSCQCVGLQNKCYTFTAAFSSFSLDSVICSLLSINLLEIDVSSSILQFYFINFFLFSSIFSTVTYICFAHYNHFKHSAYEYVANSFATTFFLIGGIIGIVIISIFLYLMIYNNKRNMLAIELIRESNRWVSAYFATEQTLLRRKRA